VALAHSYPFLSIFWSMLVFFVLLIWLWLVFSVFADVFRRHDASGAAKVLWLIFVIVFPFLGVFVYMIANNDGMTQRTLERRNR
jgi:hypothetical protein